MPTELLDKFLAIGRMKLGITKFSTLNRTLITTFVRDNEHILTQSENAVQDQQDHSLPEEEGR